MPIARKPDRDRDRQGTRLSDMNAIGPSLTVIGDIGIDLVMGPLAGWPARGTETIVDRSEMRPGFSAANAALAARHLGAPCRLIGEVGDDPLGTWLIAELGGIDARIERQPNATTLTVAVLHEDGERSFLTTRGHLEHVEWAALFERLPHAPPAAAALLTGIYLLPRLEADYPRVLADVRARGYRVAVDTGWPSSGWTPAVRAAAYAWLPLCDVLLLNEAEVLGLADLTDLAAALRSLASRLAPNGIAVAKAGAQGAFASTGGQILHHAAPLMPVFDTVGAGDSFNAAFLLAATDGASLDGALAAGTAAASTIIARFPRRAIAPGELAALLHPPRAVPARAAA